MAFFFEAADSTNKVFRVLENGTGEAYSEWYNQNSLKVLIRANGNSYFDGGNVGIGTTSPGHSLTVRVGAANQAIANFTGATVGRGLVIKTNNDGGVGDDTVIYDATQSTGSHVFEVNSTERLRIDSSGRLLIGHTASVYSSANLQVSNTSGSTVFIYNSDVSASGEAVIALGPSNRTQGAQIKCIAEEDFSTPANQTASLAFSTRKDGSIAERMRIDSSGNVGIGTTSPRGNLHLNSSDSTRIDLTNCNRHKFYRRNNYFD